MKGGMGLPDDLGDMFEARYPSPLSEARDIASELIEANGTTHTGDVLKEMENRGIDMPPTQHWAGAIFRPKAFVWTGEWTQGRGHDKIAKVWKFAP